MASDTCQRSNWIIFMGKEPIIKMHILKRRDTTFNYYALNFCVLLSNGWEWMKTTENCNSVLLTRALVTLITCRTAIYNISWYGIDGACVESNSIYMYMKWKERENINKWIKNGNKNAVARAFGKPCEDMQYCSGQRAVDRVVNRVYGNASEALQHLATASWMY